MLRRRGLGLRLILLVLGHGQRRRLAHLLVLSKVGRWSGELLVLKERSSMLGQWDRACLLLLGILLRLE